MPILDDIMDHDLFGPKIRKGIEIGRQEGRQEGERQIVLRQITKRFGPPPEWANRRLTEAPIEEVEAIALRLLDSPTLEDLLQ